MLAEFYEQYETLRRDFNAKKGNYIFEWDKYDANLIGGGKNNDTRLRLDLLPQPFVGDIENASVIICSLNPGFEENDVEVENPANPQNHADDILNQLSKSAPKSMFWLTEKKPLLSGTEKEKPLFSGGAKYWQGKFNQKNPNESFVKAVIRGYCDNGIKKSEDDVFKLLSEKIALIELFPYHSEKFDRKYLKCESTEKIREYVCNTLIKNAAENDQLICFARSYKEWTRGMTVAESGNVIRNLSVQNITFNVKKDFGRKIFEHIKKHTDNFTKP